MSGARRCLVAPCIFCVCARELSCLLCICVKSRLPKATEKIDRVIVCVTFHFLFLSFTCSNGCWLLLRRLPHSDTHSVFGICAHRQRHVSSYNMVFSGRRSIFLNFYFRFESPSRSVLSIMIVVGVVVSVFCSFISAHHKMLVSGTMLVCALRSMHVSVSSHTQRETDARVRDCIHRASTFGGCLFFWCLAVFATRCDSTVYEYDQVRRSLRWETCKNITRGKEIQPLHTRVWGGMRGEKKHAIVGYLVCTFRICMGFIFFHSRFSHSH